MLQDVVKNIKKNTKRKQSKNIFKTELLHFEGIEVKFMYFRNL